MTALALAAGYGRHRFGAIPAAFAYVRGDHVFVDGPVGALGDVPAGGTRTFRYTLTNLTGRPVKILGSRMACTCTAVGALPDRLPPAGARTVEVEFTPKPTQAAGEFTGAVKLFTDDPRHRELDLAFVARVRPARPLSARR